MNVHVWGPRIFSILFILVYAEIFHFKIQIILYASPLRMLQETWFQKLVYKNVKYVWLGAICHGAEFFVPEQDACVRIIIIIHISALYRYMYQGMHATDFDLLLSY